MKYDIYKMSDFDRVVELFRYCMKYDSITIRKISTSTKTYHYSQTFFVKQLLSSYSIVNIIKPTNRPDIIGQEKCLHDFSSGFVLLRTMYENLLNTSFVLNNKDYSLFLELVIDVITLHATKERNILLFNMKSSMPEYRDKIRNDLSMLKIKIESDDNYDILPKDIRKFIDISNNLDIPTSWNAKKLKDKPLYAGFHDSQHLQINKFLSNHVHSDGISLQQVGAVKNASDAENMCSTIFGHLENFLSQSLFLHHSTCLDNEIENVLSNEIEELINHWKEYNSIDLNSEM